MKIDILQIYYDGFINQQNKGEFLRGMADYIELAINDKDCKKIISDIPKLKQRFILENVDSEAVASKKVRLTKKDFEDIFNKESDRPDLSFGDNSFELKAQHTFEIEKKIKDGQGTTLWEAWRKMCLAYLAIFKKDKALTDIKQRDEYDAFIFESNPELAREIEQLETYSKNKQHRLVASPPEILAKEDYKPYATAVHNHLLKKLDEKQKFVSSHSVLDSQKDNIEDAKSEKDEPTTVESITIVVEKAGGRCQTIWLVFNNDFSNIVKFPTAGKRGNESYIMTLYRVRDRAQIEYDRQLATSINSKIFERKEIKGKYKQATIMEKGNDGFFRINDKIMVNTKSKEFLTQEQLKNFPFDLKYHPREFGKRPEKYKTSHNF